MKTIHVVAAVIENEGKILATQRGYGEFEGMWEFPGGKVEPGESAGQALVREINEELGVGIEVGEYICTAEYDYPNFHLKMECWMCRIIGGQIELREHKSAKWLSFDCLDSVEWLPADIEVIDCLRKRNVQ
jgi:8-oxo-dGTP diphosphatase